MRHRPPPHIADRAVAALRRRGVWWLLLLALPLHGLSAALIGMLGQSHFHAAVPAHALGRALWQVDAAASVARHEHAHAALQRHHHDDNDDASVITLEPAASDDVSAGASSAAPTLLAPPPARRFFKRAAGHLPWRAHGAGGFVSWSSLPLERPPRA